MICCSFLYTWYLLHVCLSWVRDPTSVALPEVSYIFFFFALLIVFFLSMANVSSHKLQCGCHTVHTLQPLHQPKVNSRLDFQSHMHSLIATTDIIYNLMFCPAPIVCSQPQGFPSDLNYQSFFSFVLPYSEFDWSVISILSCSFVIY